MLNPVCNLGSIRRPIPTSPPIWNIHQRLNPIGRHTGCTPSRYSHLRRQEGCCGRDTHMSSGVRASLGQNRAGSHRSAGADCRPGRWQSRRSRRSNSGSRRSTAIPAGAAVPAAGCAWCAIRGVYWFWPVGSGCLPCRSLGLCVRKLPQGKVIRIRRIAVAALAAPRTKDDINELAFPGDQKDHTLP